jgi:hypothetical protein
LGVPLPERGRRHETRQEILDFHARQRTRKKSPKHVLLLFHSKQSVTQDTLMTQRSGKGYQRRGAAKADEATLTPEE